MIDAHSPVSSRAIALLRVIVCVEVVVHVVVSCQNWQGLFVFPRLVRPRVESGTFAQSCSHVYAFVSLGERGQGSGVRLFVDERLIAVSCVHAVMHLLEVREDGTLELVICPYECWSGELQSLYPELVDTLVRDDGFVEEFDVIELQEIVFCSSDSRKHGNYV